MGQVFIATAYLVNRQATTEIEGDNSYNRVAGMKVNYLTKNRKWSGFGTYSQSFNKDLSDNNRVFSFENNYQTRTLSFSTKVNSVGKNYLTDVGFVPRIRNFDALTGNVIREGYTQFSQSVFLNVFPENHKSIQTYRALNASVNAFMDDEGDVYEVNSFFNTALFFNNLFAVYLNLYHDDIDLKYAFDPLRNESFILPGKYKNAAARLGFNSDYTKSFYTSINAQFGSFYEGKRSRFGTKIGYRFLPVLNLEVNYEYNSLDFSEAGQQNLHLLGLTAEVFFNNKLNWTTYLQYNEQINNFNINSRIQWEYKPLSFVYLVFSDNYAGDFAHKNWGVSLKVNKRFNF